MVAEGTFNRICIRMNSVYEDVRMRLYFKGESLKRKDVDYCVVQSSPDEDKDMMRGFAESAMNEVAQTVVKRMATFDWSISREEGEERIIMEFVPYKREKAEDEGRMCKIAGQAIFDYVVNFCIGEWLGVVSPELAGEYVARNEGLMFKVRKAFAGLSPLNVRRATDLAGI